jgi:hypothetical protein
MKNITPLTGTHTMETTEDANVYVVRSAPTLGERGPIIGFAKRFSDNANFTSLDWEGQMVGSGHATPEEAARNVVKLLG